MLIPRSLEAAITTDLAEKMVFVAGPRQVGKTTLAKRILQQAGQGVYLSWDRREDRQDILKAQWPSEEALIVLDELHKYRHWKRWVKGEFDKHRERLRFLVTGSARLDLYRRGGDSLQGRYHLYRLHPLTCAEIQSPGRIDLPAPGEQLRFRRDTAKDTVEALMEFGGFPEPFLAHSARVLRRWQREHLDRFFREDVRDLETVRDLSSMELLADSLAQRVASPLSFNSLREDLEVSHRAVVHWIEVFGRLYFAFLVRPYTARSIRGLKKMPKAYLWDASAVPARGARFENLVALHLLKLCHFLQDHDGYRMELHYLRDARGREVDFLVARDRQPWFAVEAKLGDAEIEPALEYFQSRLKIPWAYQVVLDGTRDYTRGRVRCLPAQVFFSGLI